MKTSFISPTNLTFPSTHLLGFSKANGYNVVTTAVHTPTGTNRMIYFSFWTGADMYSGGGALE